MEKTNIADKRFHLQMIQGTIERMASNSFIIKGWSLTALGGLFTLFIANQDKNWSYNLLWLALVCALVFWWHDAYYLKIERQYRALYKKVTEEDAGNIDFSMVPPSTTENSSCAVFSPTLLWSYGIVVVISLILLYILK
jgi:cyanate permease